MTIGAHAAGNGRAHRDPTSESVEFVATAAHELRAPLTVVSGLASLLRTHRHIMQSSELDQAFSALVRQSNRLTELLESLLDVFKLTRGDRPPNERVILTDVVAQALELLPPPASTTMSLVGSQRSPTVSGDRMGLVRVVVNLLANAYKYGGQNIVVELSRDNGHGVLGVSDDGPGLSANVATRLFEPFSRGSNGDDTPGSGLGLFLARRLVEAMDGEILYEPARPTGCSFAVRVPVVGQGAQGASRKPELARCEQGV